MCLKSCADRTRLQASRCRPSKGLSSIESIETNRCCASTCIAEYNLCFPSRIRLLAMDSDGLAVGESLAHRDRGKLTSHEGHGRHTSCHHCVMLQA